MFKVRLGSTFNMINIGSQQTMTFMYGPFAFVKLPETVEGFDLLNTKPGN